MTESTLRDRGEVAAYLTGFLTGRTDEHTGLVRAGLGLTEVHAAEQPALDYAALVLVTAEALGGQPEAALPAAGAVELVRAALALRASIRAAEKAGRFQEQLWQAWGMPRTLNAADAMVSLAHLLVLELGERSLAAAAVLDQAVLDLTEALTSGDLATSTVLIHLGVGLGAVAAGAPYEWRSDHDPTRVIDQLPEQARQRVEGAVTRLAERTPW